VQISFNSKNKTCFFDLDTIADPGLETRRENPTVADQVLRAYWANLRGRKDFDYMCRGIAKNKGNELLIIGDLTLAEHNGQ
jgi:hypothetical protein